MILFIFYPFHTVIFLYTILTHYFLKFNSFFEIFTAFIEEKGAIDLLHKM